MLTRLLNVADDTNVAGVVTVSEEFTKNMFALSLASGIEPKARLDAFSKVMLEPTPEKPEVEVIVP